jgi:CRP-like cAMP-binding protein
MFQHPELSVYNSLIAESQGLGAIHDLLLTLHPKLHERHAAAGQTIAHEGDTGSFFILVLEGWIALTKVLDGGETSIFDLMLDGDATLIAAGRASKLPCSVEAMNNTRFIIFHDKMIDGPEPEAAALRRYLRAENAALLARTAGLLLRVGHGNAETRVAYALIELYLRLEAIGKADGFQFHVPMNQRQLGQFTGLSNVHVCRTLRRFTRKGIVNTAGRTDIRILDINAICDLAGVDLEGLRDEIIRGDPA